MVLQEGGINLSRGLRERQVHGTPDFPCAGYSLKDMDWQEDIIPWHWHEEMEIIYIAEGRVELKVPSRSFWAEAGECFMINSNILHYGFADGRCCLNSLVFHPALIFGNKDSVFAKKYVQPLLNCPDFSGCLVRKSENEELIVQFLKAYGALRQGNTGFEFTVRENLSAICLGLMEKFRQSSAALKTVENQDSIRIRKMLEYIHQNYAGSLELAEIARTADIGERECMRCFQRTIQLSPMQYVLKYRIMKGAEMLLYRRESSIAQIAVLCGFDSPSNFSQKFKRFYNCTPQEYRKNGGV